MHGPAFVTTAAAARHSLLRPTLTCSPRPRARLRRWSRVVSSAAASIETIATGERETVDFRLFYKSATQDPLSPWHDIPLRPADDPAIVHFVNEIPRGTQAKMEIATDEPATPIKQDIKKGTLRFYQYGPSLVNYGAIPQTWEDPGSLNAELGVCGDGDPLDVCEIGEKVMPFGAVYAVKVLGCLALLDEGEIDWKIIAINLDDPLAGDMDDIEDVEKLMPGKVDGVREWFKMYKTAEGKGENEYAYGGEAKNAEFAIKVVEDTFESWAALKSGKIDNDGDLALK